MWETFVQHESVEEIMNDKGLAKVGDGIVNLCYSLAKSRVLGQATGEKVRDSVLARAIRATEVYRHISRRTDSGRAADAYEAIIAYLWMKGVVTVPELVDTLVETLNIDFTTNRKKEGEIAALSFQYLLEKHIQSLP
ncbi:MAG: ribonuclease III family protein [Candidatus Thorarchaeota archaeon]